MKKVIKYLFFTIWTIYCVSGIVMNFKNYNFLSWIIVLTVFAIPYVILYFISKSNKNIYIKPIDNISSEQLDENLHIRREVNILTERNNVNQNIDTNSIKTLINNIDKELISILWFYDGAFKNINTQEPSAISTKLAISQCTTSDDLGYYPSYEQMSPQQRYIYLNWLHDISQPIQIGYVFVLYYGLERHLIMGNYLKSCVIIKKLREYHSNGSFQSYSADALTMCAIKNKDFSLIEDIDINTLSPNLCAMLKMAKGENFSTEDIIKFSRVLGFSNQRYIQNEPDLFRKILSEKINNLFSLNVNHINSIKSDFIMVVANYSLNQNERILTLPDILTSTTLRNDLLTLLQQTHEDVKQAKRSTKSVISNSATNIEVIKSDPYDKKLYIYPIEYNVVPPSKLFSTNDKEKQFFKNFSNKLSSQQNNLIKLTRMSDGTISVNYDTYPVGKIKLQGRKFSMQVLKGPSKHYSLVGDLDIFIKELDNWVLYIKQHLSKF